MNRRLVISKRAEADLLEIWLWSFDRFGETQADRYFDELETGMGACLAKPQAGADRQELRPGYRSRLIGKHVIFYTFSNAEVTIQRVLHASMDLASHLP